MNAQSVLDRLAELGVTTRVEGADITIQPASKVPPELKAALRENKPEIVSRLRHRTELIDLPWPVGYGGLPADESSMPRRRRKALGTAARRPGPKGSDC